MGETVRRTVVVSAVNIRKGGTLTILRECLKYLSALSGEYRIVALVHRREIACFDGIEYIEMPWCIRSWACRLWAEYVTMMKISRRIASEDGGRKVWTWISLHDTTPRVEAEHREVYCQTSFPFLRLKFSDLYFDPKIVLFALFTRWAYRINVRKNDCLIVQQEWFADALSKLVGVDRSRFRVIPPSTAAEAYACTPETEKSPDGPFTFLFVSTADCHKNFETLLAASELLERETGPGRFRLVITVKGDENRYARYLRRRWGRCSCIDFHGIMGKQELYRAYADADCFVFPSRVETWGLPISEFLSVQKDGRLLLSDLPYAHETARDAVGAVFFNPTDKMQLLEKMKKMVI